MKIQTTKANKKQINRSTKHCNAEKNRNQERQQKRRTNNERLPESLKNGPQNQKMEARFDQKSLKIEPRGGKNRMRARKLTQDSVRQLPRAAMVAQTRLSGNSEVPKWRPKSTKIDENMCLITLRIDFSSIFDRKIADK